MTKRVFVDTGAWLAYLLIGEEHHREIDAYIKKLISQKARLFTSDYVLDESYTRLITNQSFSAAKALHKITDEAVESGHLQIVYSQESSFHETWSVFAKYSDHQFSFTDANCILCVQKFKVDEILTLDSGFQKAGLKTYPNLGRP